MLMNEIMKTRIMASFLDTTIPARGYLTASSFINVANMIVDGDGEENAEISFKYFSLNILSEEYTCNVYDWRSIDDQQDNWKTVVQAMIKKGKIMHIIDNEDGTDFLVIMELLGTTVIFNCLDGIVGMLIHKGDVDTFVRDANLSR